MALTSTIYGYFRNAENDALISTLVQFELQGAPLLSDGDLVVSNVVAFTTNASGYIGDTGVGGDTVISLVTGTYRVVVSDVDAFYIFVPDDAGDYDISAIITSLDPTGSGSSTPSSSSSGSAALNLVSTQSVRHVSTGDPNETRKRIIFFGEGMIDISDRTYRLIQALDPDELVALGNLNTGGLAGTIDDNIGQPFHSWIHPYTGAHGAGSADSVNHFWYALGNQDWIPGNVTAVTNFFAFPNNERYYKVSLAGGNIALFIIDSNASEPDGNTAGSTQGLWLQTQLLAASEKVKLVCFRDSPYASRAGYSFVNMQWPLKSWGATAVIAAGVRFSERLNYDTDLPLFVAGGAWENSSAETIGTPLAASQFRYNSNPAILVLDINTNSISSKLMTLDGLVFDKYTLTLPADALTRSTVDLSVNNGLRHYADGIGVDNYFALGQVYNPVDVFFELMEGRVYVLSDADFTALTNQVATKPWLKKSLFLVGENPFTNLYGWNAHTETFVVVIAPGSVSTTSVAALTVLDPPTITPSSGEAGGCRVQHVTAATELWIAIDGGDFFEAADLTDHYVYFGTPGRHWVAAYARKATFADSSIVTAQLTTP